MRRNVFLNLAALLVLMGVGDEHAPNRERALYTYGEKKESHDRQYAQLTLQLS